MTTIALRLFTIAILLWVPHAAMAQSPQPATAPAQADQLLKPEQLDAWSAPIALYPEPLLAEILMASTYPLEVVEADRWAEANKNLKGDALKAAVDKQSWDDSVKSLVGDAVGARHDEHQARLDAGTRRCGAGATAGRDGCRAAAACQSAGEQQARCRPRSRPSRRSSRTASRRSSSRRRIRTRFTCRITTRR